MTSTEPTPDPDTAREAAARPDPEHPAKPDSPADLSRPARFFTLRATLREFREDECLDIAAALTYYAVLALFPALLALMSLVGLVGQGRQSVDTILQVLRQVGAGSVASTLEPTLVALSASPSAGLALVAGLATALWSASGYVGSFGRAMNRILEIGEGRPFWKLRPTMILVTLLAVVLSALVLLGLVVTGPAATAVGEALGIGGTAVTVFSIVKWPVMLVAVVAIVALLYYATPNIEQPRFRWISVGAVLAIVVWALASTAFGFYVANFSSYDKTYGSLAGVVVFLLWLWITNLALLLGAELDSELERARQLQAGLAAEEELQLPPRDTRNLVKAERTQAKALAEARALRRGGGDDASGRREEDDDTPS